MTTDNAPAFVRLNYDFAALVIPGCLSPLVRRGSAGRAAAVTSPTAGGSRDSMCPDMRETPGVPGVSRRGGGCWVRTNVG